MEETEEIVNGINTDLRDATFFREKSVVVIKLSLTQGILFCDHGQQIGIDSRYVLLADPTSREILRITSFDTLKIYYRNEPPIQQSPLSPSAIMAFKLRADQELLLEEGSSSAELKQGWLIVNAISGTITSILADGIPQQAVDPYNTRHIYRGDLIVRAKRMDQPFNTFEQGTWYTHPKGAWLIESFEYGHPGKRLGINAQNFDDLYEEANLKLEDGRLVTKS